MNRLVRSFLFLIVPLFLGISCRNPVSDVEYYAASGVHLPLHALTASARTGVLASSGAAAWFGLPENAQPGAIEVILESDIPLVEVSLSLAFAGHQDMDRSGRPLTNPAPRAVSSITGASSVFVLRMELPQSIFSGDMRSAAVTAVVVQAQFPSTGKIRIVSIREVLPFYGWFKRNGKLHAGFSSIGGEFNPLLSRYPNIPALPESHLVIDLAPGGTAIGTQIRQDRETFRFADFSFSFRKTPGPGRSWVPSFLFPSTGIAANAQAQALNLDSAYLEGLALIPGSAFPDRAGIDIQRLSVGQIISFEPVPADPRQILLWPQDAWRQKEFEVFSWDRFPQVLIVDTANYRIQDRLFKRLAFFVEKQGYSGKLWSDRDLRGLHAFNAHDYRADSLAEFYTLAEKEGFELNTEENSLRKILENTGIIIRSDSGWTGGSGAVLSLSRESVDYLRSLFMTHECFHGLYFITPDFREFVSQVYHSMDSLDIAFLEGYFTGVDTLGYDSSNSFLMENEFMAYLLQQSTAQVSAYFTNNLCERFLRYDGDPALGEWIQKTGASGFVEAAEKLNEFVFSRWGIVGGRVSLYVSN